MNNFVVNGLLISAGFSSRMGEFKPLMLKDKETFVVAIIKKMITVCKEVYVVTGFRNVDVEKEIQNELAETEFKHKVHLIFNHEYEKGMLTSLQAGIKFIEQPCWVLYHFVDQPTLPENFYTELISEIDNRFDWIQPLFNNEHGHPILFNSTLFEKIGKLTFQDSLRSVKEMKPTKIKLWKCDYPEVLDNYNYLVQ